MSCSVEMLAEMNLFELFDEADRRALAVVVDAVKLGAGDVLFHNGEPGDSLFVVKSGEIELFIKDTVGQKIVLNVSGKNDLFGEVSVMDNRPHTATAVALTDTELLELDRGDLLEMFRRKPETALRMLAAFGEAARGSGDLLRTRVSRNLNEMMEQKLSLFERAADWIAWFSGSVQFLLLNAVWFAVWITLNTLPFGVAVFDPFPFGLLTMIVSLEAIFLSCFVLISQNRQTEKDRVRADIEYEVNIKAEMEVQQLHEKTDRVYEQMLDKFARLEKLTVKEN